MKPTCTCRSVAILCLHEGSSRVQSNNTLEVGTEEGYNSFVFFEIYLEGNIASVTKGSEYMYVLHLDRKRSLKRISVPLEVSCGKYVHIVILSPPWQRHTS